MTPTGKDSKDALNVTVRIMGKEYTVACPQEEHEALVSALADRDGDKARHIAERHVLDAGRSLADWLEQTNPGSTTNHSSH